MSRSPDTQQHGSTSGNGSMGDAFRKWVNSLAKQYQGTISRKGNAFRFETPSREWENVAGSRKPVLLSSSPSSKKAWMNRLHFVEKCVARAVTSAPVGFCCKICTPPKRQKGKYNDVTVLRMAFGFSSSIGRCLRQRFTAYFVIEWDRSLYISGEDQLFNLKCEMLPLDLEVPDIKNGLSQLLSTVHEAQEVYYSSDLVQSQLDRLRPSLSRELADLDRLYTVNYGQYARLLGRASVGLRGEDAIEVEYVNRLEDIFAQYQPTIIFEPLTFGVIHCAVKIKGLEDSTQIEFPFLKGLSLYS